MPASHLDAVALLEADHREVEGLFAKFQAAKGAGNRPAIAAGRTYRVGAA
ncbi:MAG TPA: hypothetical protein VKQ54_01345 [Caulobacteraceae bacterium]|nr:hypothetical protein [Caulobacteraceae bacterium]